VFKAIKAWLAARVAAAQRRQYDAGYNWAAQELEAGTAPDIVSATIDDVWEDSHFDRGAEEALYRWHRQAHTA
jgi:hypothetical protein